MQVYLQNLLFKFVYHRS